VLLARTESETLSLTVIIWLGPKVGRRLCVEVQFAVGYIVPIGQADAEGVASGPFSLALMLCRDFGTSRNVNETTVSLNFFFGLSTLSNQIGWKEIIAERYR
jgi:hypothetical protein